MRVKTVPPATYDYVELILMKQSEVPNTECIYKGQ